MSNPMSTLTQRLRHLPVSNYTPPERRGVWRAMDIADAFGVDLGQVRRGDGAFIAYDGDGAPVWRPRRRAGQ